MGFNPSQVQFTQTRIVILSLLLPEFQSLTGSIHTNLRVPRHPKPLKPFQSLTGSIHTPSTFSYLPSGCPFQSLTGSIHTREAGRFVCLTFTCFNPSQVQFTRGSSLKNIPIWLKFQSLTGSIHTLSPAKLSSKKYNVSIPHRFNSHL